MKKWQCTIEIPESITPEQLKGEISETLAAGFDLEPEKFSVTVTPASE